MSTTEYVTLVDTNGDECYIRRNQIVKIKRVVPQTGRSEGIPCLVVSCKVSDYNWDETWILDLPENRQELGMKPYVARTST